MLLSPPAPATDKPHEPVVAWLRKRRGGLVDLLCSPNAHTRSIVLSRKAVLVQARSRRSSHPRLEETRASLVGACRCSPSPPGRKGRVPANRLQGNRWV